MSTDRELDSLVDRLKRAEQAVAGSLADFERLRNCVDSAGEMALWERVESAKRALYAAIGHLDEIVYPNDGAADDG